MLTIKSLVFVLLFALPSFANSKIEVGSPAPKVSGTNEENATINFEELAWQFASNWFSAKSPGTEQNTVSYFLKLAKLNFSDHAFASEPYSMSDSGGCCK